MPSRTTFIHTSGPHPPKTVVSWFSLSQYSELTSVWPSNFNSEKSYIIFYDRGRHSFYKGPDNICFRLCGPSGLWGLFNSAVVVRKQTWQYITKWIGYVPIKCYLWKLKFAFYIIFMYSKIYSYNLLKMQKSKNHS